MEPIANGHGAATAHATAGASGQAAGQPAQQPLLSEPKKPEVVENGICEVKIEVTKDEVKAAEPEAVEAVVASVDQNGQTRKDQSPTKDAVEV